MRKKREGKEKLLSELHRALGSYMRWTTVKVRMRRIECHPKMWYSSSEGTTRANAYITCPNNFFYNLIYANKKLSLTPNTINEKKKT